jgi:short-subunit dehydrogenase
MKTTTQQTILITGATDGIGLALARHYAGLGARLILIGRRPLATLDDPLFTPHTYCQIDLAAPGFTPDLTAWLAEREINTLDWVLLNAATGYIGDLADQPIDQVRRLLWTNLWANLELTRMLIPKVTAPEGAIAYISSVVVSLPSPDYAVYTASKAALESFVRNLRSELRAEGNPLRLLIVRPGATQTGLHVKSVLSGEPLNTAHFAQAEQVAAQIATALTRRPQTVTLGLIGKITYWAGRLAAGPMQAALRRRRAAPVGDPAPPHVAITGAAGGIGHALALRFAAAGYRITAIDIDRARLDALAAELAPTGVQTTTHVADLTQPDGCLRLIAELATQPPITVWIHNAGISAVGPFTQQPLEPQQAVVELNLMAPLCLTVGLAAQTAQPIPRSLVYISSLSVYVGYPGAAVYAATKEGVASFAASLRALAAPTQQHILTVYPGPTRTEHAARYSPDNRNAHRRMDPAHLADRIFVAVTRRQAQLLPGFSARAMAAVGSLAPGLMALIMRRTLYAKLRALP